MAETLGAAIQLDISQALGSLQALSAQMQQFASNVAAQLQRATAAFQTLPAAIQQVTQATAQSTQASQQQTQASQQQAASTNQLATAYLAMAQAIHAQTQGYTQAQAAALAFRQQQAALAQATQAANAQARQAATLWQQAFSVAAGLGLVTSIQGILASFRQFATESVAVAVKMQSITAAFVAITGSAAAAQRELGFLRDTAQRVGVDFLSTAGSFRSMEAAARGTRLEGEGVRQIFVSIIEAARVLGLSQDQVKLSLLALEQMISKGKISSEELRRQLGEHLPGALSIMARAVGVSTAQLNDMMKQGALLSEDVLPAFGRQVSKEFGPGLENATRQAAATFARFGNNVRDIMQGVGESILKFLQPALDAVNRLTEQARGAQARLEQRSAELAAGIVAGKPVFGVTSFQAPSGATSQEAERLGAISREMAEMESGIRVMYPKVLAQLEAEFKDILKIAEARAQVNRLAQSDIASLGEYPEKIARIHQANESYKKSVKELTDLTKQLPDDLQKSVVKATLLPESFTSAEVQLKRLQKSAKDFQEILDKKPALTLDPAVQQAMEKYRDINKTLEDQIQLQKDNDKAQKDAARSAKQWAEELKDVAKPTSLTELQQKIAAIQQAMQQPGLLPGQWQELVLRMQELQRQADELVDPLKRLQTEALAGLGDALGGTAEMFKEAATANAAYRDAIEKTNVLLGKGESTFERQRVQLRQQIADIEKVTGETVKTREALSSNLDRIAEAETKKSDEELRKQQRNWERFAEEIQRPLASAFESMLTGAGNLFDSLKQMFIKLLADMAAAVVANKIVIPLLLNVVGAGILGGTGEGSVAGSAGGAAAIPSAFGQRIQGLTNATTQAGGTGSLSSTSIGSLSKTLASTPLKDIFGSGAGSVSQQAALSPEGLTEQEVGATGTTMGATESGFGTATVGDALGGIGAGLALGGMVNSAIYGNNMTTWQNIASTVGAVGGALVGSYFFGSAGGVVGGFIGSIVGAFEAWALGSLFGMEGPKEASWQVTGMQRPNVTFDPRTGLQLSRPFAIQDAKWNDLGRVGIGTAEQQWQGSIVGKDPLEEFHFMIESSLNGMFQGAIAQFRNTAPQIQAALADTLTNEFQKIVDAFTGWRYRGQNLGEHIQQQLTTLLPTMLERNLAPLREAVGRINPVVMAFNQIIKQAHDDIIRLQQAAMAQHLSLQASIVGIQQSQFTPAQTFESQRTQLAQARTLLENASPQQRPGLISGMQGLIQDIMQTGGNRDVFGADMGRADAIQEQINALIEQSAITGAPLNMQTLKSLQDELALEQQRQSESGAQLRALQQELITMLQGLQETSAGAFSTMTDIAAEQAKLANAQITTLVDSLKNLDSVPAVVENAMQVLIANQQAMASISTQGQQDINTQTQLALLTGQIEALQSINQVEIASLQVLQQIANSLAFVPQRQSGIAYVPHNQLSYIHRGEAVIPAHQNRGGTRGGGDVTIHINAGELNPKQLAQMVSRELESGGRMGRHRVSVKER